MAGPILTIQVGEPISADLDRAWQMMDALDQGRTPDPYFGIGFGTIDDFLAVFTPPRWDIVSTLRRHGPMSITDIATRLQRAETAVRDDLRTLKAWYVLDTDEEGRVEMPYGEIRVDIHLPGQAACAA